MGPEAVAQAKADESDATEIRQKSLMAKSWANYTRAHQKAPTSELCTKNQSKTGPKSDRAGRKSDMFNREIREVHENQKNGDLFNHGWTQIYTDEQMAKLRRRAEGAAWNRKEPNGTGMLIAAQQGPPQGLRPFVYFSWNHLRKMRFAKGVGWLYRSCQRVETNGGSPSLGGP